MIYPEIQLAMELTLQDSLVVRTVHMLMMQHNTVALWLEQTYGTVDVRGRTMTVDQQMELAALLNEVKTEWVARNPQHKDILTYVMFEVEPRFLPRFGFPETMDANDMARILRLLSQIGGADLELLDITSAH
jgi:hypothetical protein